MKMLFNFTIFLLQMAGAVLVGVGLSLIWMPLAWIYAGVAMYFFGYALYLVMKSEDIEK